MPSRVAKARQTVGELRATVGGLMGHIKLLNKELGKWERGEYFLDRNKSYKRGYRDGVTETKRETGRIFENLLWELADNLPKMIRRIAAEA